MAEPEINVRHGGVPWKVSQEQVPDIIESGGKLIPHEEAVSGTQALNDLTTVDQNWGVAGKLGLGLASGLSLGLAPGMMGLDPGLVQAAQTSPWYTAGDVGGTLLPGLLSGGSSLEARSAIGQAMRWTPAGILDMAGTGTERLVGGILGNEVGTLGRLAQTPLKMAARGAVEGAAINLGHTVGDNLIQNKPLSAEALLASGADGALFGGLIGGTLGTVGSLGSMAVESMGSVAKGALGKRPGLWMKKVGMGEAEIKAASEAEGGIQGFAKDMQTTLERGGSGAKIGSSDEKLLGGFKTSKEAFLGDQMAVAKALDEQAAHIAPPVARMVDRIDQTVVAPYAGSFAHEEVSRLAQVVKGKLQSMTPMQELAPVKVADKVIPGVEVKKVKVPEKTIPGTKFNEYGNELPLHKQTSAKVEPGYEIMGFKTPDTVEPGYEIMGGKFPSSEKPTWERWITSMDQMEKDVMQSSAPHQVKVDIMNVVKHELSTAMGEAGKLQGLEGIAEKYAAARTGIRIAEQMEESLGKRAANKLLSTSPTITPNELAYAGLMAANGNPAAAIAFAAGKGIMKKVVERMEPAMAQAAFDMSIGAKAARATTDVQSRMGQAMKKFFSSASKTPSKAGYVSNASKEKTKRPVMDRKAYETMATRTEQLLSANHQDKVRRYNEALHGMGYADLATALMSTNNRGVQYLMYNMPARQGAKGMESLRQMPASKVPTLKEYKYFRQAKGVLDPLSVLDDLQSGNLSRDQVMAMKYTYPELHNEMVFTGMQEVAAMKAQGGYLPMDKITNLSILLDAPLDSTQTPEYVGAVQVAHNSPNPMEEPPEQDAPAAMGTSVTAQDLMTVTQKLATA